jgi:hypothetical protein
MGGMTLKSPNRKFALSNYSLLGGECNGSLARGTELKLLNTLIPKGEAADILTTK